MFKNDFEIKVHNHQTDSIGNVLILDIEISKVRMSLVSIYGPNEDNPTFYERLQNSIVKFGNDKIIITGDWNLLLDPSIDGKNYKKINNPLARQRVLKLIAELKLYDSWREQNGDRKMFTWKRKIGKGDIQMGRLDFFLVSESVLNYVSEEEIIPGYRSDHSATSIALRFSESPRGKTFWKFNSSLLKNSEFVKETKDTISKIKIKYAASPYNIDNIDSIEK